MSRTIILSVVAAIGIGAAGYASFGTPATGLATPQPVPTSVADHRSGNPLLEPVGGLSTPSGGFTGDVVEGGGTDAKVTIVEYTSFTCPHCKTFHDDVYKRFKADYIDTGKVRFIYRDFPLDNPSLAVSIVSRCGGPDKYLGFTDLFMSQQRRWTKASNYMDEVRKMARLGGLGSERIDACLSDAILGQSVIDRAKMAETELGVSATPTILLNGERYAGPLTLDAFTARLNTMLDE